MYLHITEIFRNIVTEESTALRAFHCFTGCGTTSAFFEKSKRLALETWNSYPEVTEAFNLMMVHQHTPMTTDSCQFQQLGRFTIIMYDKSNGLQSAKKALKELFCKKVVQWRTFLQHKRLCCCTQSVSHTSLESERLVRMPSSKPQLQRDVVGRLTWRHGPGALSRAICRWQPRLTMNYVMKCDCQSTGG